jgi:uncharacterized protein YifN (PemK superfamily)
LVAFDLAMNWLKFTRIGTGFIGHMPPEMVSRRLVVTLLNGGQSVASGGAGNAASSGNL